MATDPAGLCYAAQKYCLGLGSDLGIAMSIHFDRDQIHPERCWLYVITCYGNDDPYIAPASTVGFKVHEKTLYSARGEDAAILVILKKHFIPAFDRMIVEAGNKSEPELCMKLAALAAALRERVKSHVPNH